MGTVTSTRGQVKTSGGVNVIPDSAAQPAAHSDFLKIANAMEAKLVLRVANAAALGTLAPVETGMMATTTSAPIEVYVATSTTTWAKVWPMIYSGTAAPSAGLGADGDLYIQY